MTIHPIPPTYNENSEILILGSFPSVKSRETGYFYGHPQNRFWKVLAMVYDEPCPTGIPDRKAFLLEHHIAVWDVIASCEIHGSSDTSIKNVIPNDLSIVLDHAHIKTIYLNGRTADRLYKKHFSNDIILPTACLPSTSPANAGWRLEKLVNAWKIILNCSE